MSVVEEIESSYAKSVGIGFYVPKREHDYGDDVSYFRDLGFVQGS